MIGWVFVGVVAGAAIMAVAVMIGIRWAEEVTWKDTLEGRDWRPGKADDEH